MNNNIKCILLGNFNCGKTCIASRIIQNKFDDFTTPTIGASFFCKDYFNDDKNKTVSVQFWDTAGHDRYYSLSKLYYSSSDIILLCYDLTELSSFNKLDKYLKDIKDHCNNINVKIIIIGNKLDLIDSLEVKKKHQEIYSEKYKMFEISAKTNKNIDSLIDYFKKEIFNIQKNNNIDIKNIIEIEKKEDNDDFFKFSLPDFCIIL